MNDKKDVLDLFVKLTSPLEGHYSPGCAFLELDYFGAHYDVKSSYMEGFSRVVWGLAPFLAGGGKSELLNNYIKGIKNGTDPQSNEYWGNLHDVDQKLVELAPIAFFLLVAPEYAWMPLDEETKENLVTYLYRANEVVVPRSNWLFFRILINIALKKTGNSYSKEKLNEDLEYVDSFYIGNGYYTDGIGGQVDYYNPFAIHFYSLIYAKFMKSEDAKRCERFIERASDFAKQFIHWFDNCGRAIPFGRSMTYRFAMSAFFGALAFCDVEAIPWSTMKAVVMKNMRWWMQQPIFARDGVLTVGYAYPNLIMSEEYNSPASPYWALKWFILLAVDENHPFWKAEEDETLPNKKVSVQKEKNFLIQKIEDGEQVVALCSGQYVPNGFANFTAKYSKFAYSSKYAFSVSRGCDTLRTGAFDSVLALKAEGDSLFHVREKNEIKEINEKYILSEWSPYRDVHIQTYLIPCGEFHVRVHKITSQRNLYAVEGGFSIAQWESDLEKVVECDAQKALVGTNKDISLVHNLWGYKNGNMAFSQNTNLHFQRSVLPFLEGEVRKGENLFACAVFAGSRNARNQDIVRNMPQFIYENEQVNIVLDDTKIFTIDFRR